MGFFATFWNWLNGQLVAYIGDNVARLAAALEPAVVTFATLYVMAWGYLHMTGKIEEPVSAGLKRIAILALVLGVGLRLWLYNTVIVDTFYNAPSQLAAAVIGAADPVNTLDVIWEQGGAVADFLWDRAGVRDWQSAFVAILIWVSMGVLCVYAMFLIALSSVALAILLALGPLFIAMLLFDATRRFFSAWIAQLANYGFITLLTVMVGALLLRIVQSYATQTAAKGSAILTVDALNMLLMSGLVLLILRQVMPIAASLAGGSSLNSFSLASRSVGLGFRGLGHFRRASAPAAKYAASGVRAGMAGAISGPNGARNSSAEAAGRAGETAATGTESLGASWRDSREN